MKDIFFNELKTLNTSFMVSKWMLDTIPYLFSNDLNTFIDWKEAFAQNIGVDSGEIIFTGSSCIGFSLNPYKNFKPFDRDSDIDIAIISRYHFDISWYRLRNLNSDYYSLTPSQRTSVDDHRKRLIFWGTIATDKILPIMPYANPWIEASKKMQQTTPTENREINFRVYKDHQSFRDYQINTFKTIREKIISTNIINETIE